MKSSMGETETEKSSEYVTVKFLLKQVYAAHTSKVKELESEIKSLKQKLEESARLASSKSECEKCKQEMAIVDYGNEETRLNDFDVCSDKAESNKGSATPDCASDLEVIEETMMDVGNEHSVCEVEDSPRKTSGSTKVDSMSHESLTRWLAPAAMQDALLTKDVQDTTASLHDDAVLVPDTMEEAFGVQKCLENKESPAVGNRKCRSLGETPKQGKENQGISNELKGKTIKSKKRALSEVALNEVLASNKKINGKLKESQQLSRKQEVLNVEQSVLPISSNNKNMKNILSSDPSDKWAELYHDFQNSSSKPNQLGTSKTNKPTSEEEDDFVIKNSEDTSTWKSSVKKNSFKKSAPVKAIKSTSRFKMILEAPDLNAKKVTYKQTTLPMSCFVSSKTVGKDSGGDVVVVDSNGSESNKAVEASSMADVSQLARLAGSGSTTCLSGMSGDQTPSPIAEATHASVLSETLCPLRLIAKNMPQEEQDEDIFVIDCIGGENAKSDDEPEKGEAQQNYDSFDRVPTEDEPNYKYKEDVVRNKNKRKQLDGFDCKECEKYYSELGISEEEKRKRMKNCSRHRAKFMPPSTPAHFWELEFPDTEECKARGYMAETQKVKLTSRRRRPLDKE